MRFIAALSTLSFYYLKGNINLEGEVLKVKIDSFDTKREQSPISHFHGNNLYTTSRETQHFSAFQHVEHNPCNKKQITFQIILFSQKKLYESVLLLYSLIDN